MPNGVASQTTRTASAASSRSRLVGLAVELVKSKCLPLEFVRLEVGTAHRCDLGNSCVAAHRGTSRTLDYFSHWFHPTPQRWAVPTSKRTTVLNPRALVDSQETVMMHIDKLNSVSDIAYGFGFNEPGEYHLIT